MIHQLTTHQHIYLNISYLRVMHARVATHLYSGYDQADLA